MGKIMTTFQRRTILLTTCEAFGVTKLVLSEKTWKSGARYFFASAVLIFTKKLSSFDTMIAAAWSERQV